MTFLCIYLTSNPPEAWPLGRYLIANVCPAQNSLHPTDLCTFVYINSINYLICNYSSGRYSISNLRRNNFQISESSRTRKPLNQLCPIWASPKFPIIPLPRVSEDQSHPGSHSTSSAPVVFSEAVCAWIFPSLSKMRVSWGLSPRYPVFLLCFVSVTGEFLLGVQNYKI